MYIVFADPNELPFATLFTTGNKYFNLGLRSRAKHLKMKLGTWAIKYLDNKSVNLDNKNKDSV